MDAPDVQPEFDLIDSPDGTCHPATASLMQVLKTVAIPGLLRAPRRPADGHGVPVADPCAAELARLLVATDPAPAYALIDDRRRQDSAGSPLSASLFEPTARQLGDLWLADDCTEVDVTLRALPAATGRASRQRWRGAGGCRDPARSPRTRRAAAG